MTQGLQSSPITFSDAAIGPPITTVCRTIPPGKLQANRSTVKIGRKQQGGDGNTPGGPGYLDMKNIHKFVLDLNKRAAAKQQGLLSPDLGSSNQGMGEQEKGFNGILAFAGIPFQELDTSVSESPSMCEPNALN